MLLQEPIVEFVEIPLKDVIVTSAGYVNCENSGPETGFGSLASMCAFMENGMSNATYECVMAEAANDEYPGPEEEEPDPEP